jgi:3-hydroxy-9,10-secoandrosta-1,3,5(10)-triene-9,17-dione monooxygenase
MDFRSFCVQRHDYDIVDDWFVVGLAGTGSKKLLLKQVFVPEYRSHSVGAYGEETQGHVSNLYKMPFFYVFNAVVSSVIIGMARGMVDLYIEHMKPRQNLNQAVGAAVNDPFIRSALGEAHAKITSCIARVINNTEEAWSYASTGRLVPLDVRIRNFTTSQFTGQECFEAAHSLFKKTSTRGIWSTSPIQRQMRDILVGANHITQNQDNMGDLLGGHLLDNPLPQPNPFGVRL